MLASAITEWPEGGGWVLEPKYDGYRLLVETRPGGRVCAWSRHGTSLTEPLRELLVPLGALGAGWVFDGELIALSNLGGHPVQDFAAVGRAVFGRDHDAGARLHYVAFDLLAAGDVGDIQHRPWLQRTALLAERFPANQHLRTMSALPATADAHNRLIAMGFEGSVLKRQSASYQPGRSRSWRKLKARHEMVATVGAVHEDHDGRTWARCVLGDGRRCSASADARAQQLVGQQATIVYSRTDADGGLREARLRPGTSSALPAASTVQTAR
jgi:ATP-dependent DNA ligase